MEKKPLLLDMNEAGYYYIVGPNISKIMSEIEKNYSKDELMEQRRYWVFVVAPVFCMSLLRPEGGMEHMIAFEGREGELVSWIDFELSGFLYTHGNNKEFYQKIERFKKIGQAIFMDNNDITKFKFTKINKEITNDAD